MTDNEYLAARPHSKSEAMVDDKITNENAKQVDGPSWSKCAARIWKWLGQKQYVPDTTLPPTLILSDEMPETTDTRLCGECLSHWTVSGKSVARVDWMYPMELSIILYTNNILKSFDVSFEPYVIFHKTVIETYMIHIILHEFCHYMTMVQKYSQACKRLRDKDDWTRETAYNDLYNHISKSLGHVEDEVENEKITMRLLKEFITDILIKQEVLSGSFIPRLGSRFDDYMLRQDIIYALLMGTLRVIVLSNYDLLGPHYYNETEGFNIQVQEDVDVLLLNEARRLEKLSISLGCSREVVMFP